MADDHKKDFAIDVTINPYGECKKSEVPAWFGARPKLTSLVSEIQVKRTLKLDGRKWRKKDLEDGVYAVAKYDLAVFSAALTTLEKDIDKAFDANKENAKKKRDAKFYRNNKKPTKDEDAALSTAEKKVTALWKKIAKNIDDKVSLALDEVASDKGDNKKALAAGKQALKVFDRIDTSTLFAKPLQRVLTTLNTLKASIVKDGADKEAAFDKALRELRDIESDYDLTAKSTGKVAKMFLALSEKMSKDKNADPELQKFGEDLSKGPVKASLTTLVANIKDMGRDMDALVNFVAKGDHDAKAVAAKAGKFKGDHSKKKGSAKTATDAMKKLSTQFKKLEKKLK